MKWLIYDAKRLKLMLWFLRYFISKFKIRQIRGSRKPSVNITVKKFYKMSKLDKLWIQIINKKKKIISDVKPNVRPKPKGTD